jgi:alginate O-acetyltransferase complex protein AlgI
MIFSDPHFLIWIFLPFAIFCVADRLIILPFAFRFWFVVGLSLIYYYFGPGSSMPLLAAYVVGNFLLLRPIERSDHAMLIVAVINVVALFYIKAVRPGGAPLGISFHAFQIVGLLVARIQSPKMPIPAYGYFLFLTFFPQLSAGPIVHWNRVHRFFEHWRNQERRTIEFDIILLFIAIGLGKKVFISDSLYEAVHRFESGGAFVGIDSLIFPFLYSIYLYFDFSSYSDIATGIAMMIGMRMPINFYSPYKAASPVLFWRRWHRTLYKFLRNDLRFVYHRLRLPGGPLFVAFVFLFSGFWHGAAWGFSLWSVGHLAYFLLYPRRLMRRVPQFLAVAANFVIVSLLWLPFSLGGYGVVRWAEGLWNFICSIGSNVRSSAVHTVSPVELLVTVLGVGIALAGPNGFQLAAGDKMWSLKRGFAAVVAGLALLKIFTANQPPLPFAYFQF